MVKQRGTATLTMGGTRVDDKAGVQEHPGYFRASKG
jgi:hypothetical protein